MKDGCNHGQMCRQEMKTEMNEWADGGGGISRKGRWLNG